ncbi:hypothetical protein [Amycolatopsis echigonensis]|uniref:Uncharacterized protein n=1 Tax=Amycolatopsis echigonensis TaxID=2576905 RepID=A0A2N3WS44_9PSEU|nr:hypothetical protein [Amycolatopsis niigatensis]PKV96704.1 hypothetical protein ATK30_7664 [Amycolatopsis niigatensis]
MNHHESRQGHAADRSWDSLPERLADTARQVAAELHEGRPGTALDLVDSMLAELSSRRRLLAELVNVDD